MARARAIYVISQKTPRAGRALGLYYDSSIAYHVQISAVESSSLIPRTLYRFGGLGGGHFCYMVLRADGSIGAYSHPNESRYELCGAALRFLDGAGAVTSRLRHYPDANVFLADGASDLHLLPLLTLAPALDRVALRPLIINSIPKSGTYFAEAAAVLLGAVPLRLHLFAHFCHDYRGVPEDEMHRTPDARVIGAPAGAVAALMRPGDVVVGHIDDPARLDEVAGAGVQLLHMVRDLREVLISLYYFKKTRVNPVSPADTAWRTLPPAAGFVAFLCRFEALDIAHIARMAEVILTRPEPVLRYEDAVRGIVPPGLPDALHAGLGAALQEVRGRPTATLSCRNREEVLWSDAAEGFFAASGLKALNARLGYNAPWAAAE